MDKLLFMGASTDTKTALQYCREIGVYTIITDYIPREQHRYKKMADESWNIDLNEIDKLEQKCREENIKGVYAGNNEYCLDRTQALAKRLGLPFYASDEGWLCARDKARFKEHCMEVGLDVAKKYDVKKPFTEEMLQMIQYPVIVKPVDSSASRGVTICHNEKELVDAYDYALSFSSSGNVLVEDYIVGFEVAPHHFVVDGKVQFTSMCDIIYGNRENGNNMSYTIEPSSVQNEYMEKCFEKVQALCTRLGCRRGNFYFELIYSNGKFYFLELIHRVEGVGIWSITQKMQGFNSVKRMVCCALGYPDPPVEKPEKKYGCGGIYFYWAKPGMVASIVGHEEVEKMDGVEFISERFRVGDTIKESNDMCQMAYYISVVAKDRKELIAKYQRILDTLHIYDENGDELTDPMLYYDDNILNGKKVERIL